ncbi:hypothetical protein DBR27_02375, partial [Flavobacterium sp. HMWF030]
MKKTALTFGLFSLVLVTTSFVTPQTVSHSYTNGAMDIDGGQRGNDRKKTDDFAMSTDIDGGQRANDRKKTDDV